MSTIESRRKIRPIGTKPSPKPIASGLAFSGLCSIRNTEGHLRWLGAQVSFFLNPPAYAAFAFRIIQDPGALELVVLLIGSLIFGTATEYLHQIIKRDSKLMEFWNDSITNVERTNKIEGGVEVFTSARYQRLRSSRDRLQRRLESAMLACTIAWALCLNVAFAMLLVKGGVL